MLQLELTAAQTNLWNIDPQWKMGFVAGLQLALGDQPTVSVLEIQDNTGGTLLKARKSWRNL